MASVTIAGIEFQLRDSMRAFQKWEEATGKKMNQLNEETSPTQICLLAYFFAEAGMKRDGKEMPISVGQWMDEVGMAELEEISVAVAAAMVKPGQKKAPVKKVVRR